MPTRARLAAELGLHGKCVVLTLVGELTPFTVAVLRLRLDAAIELRRPPLLVIDTAGVTYVDADAFVALIDAQRKVSELGGRLVLTGMRKYPMLHWDEQTFDARRSVDEALAELNAI